MTRLVFLALIVLAGCQTQSPPKLTLAAREQLAWPKSVDESVAYLTQVLDETETRELYASTEANLRQRQSKLLFYIRKRFGLDRGNDTLLRATGMADADGAAFAILKTFWRRTKTAMDDPANQ